MWQYSHTNSGANRQKCRWLLLAGRYYRDVALEKLKIYYQKRRPAKGFQYVCLLHDNHKFR